MCRNFSNKVASLYKFRSKCTIYTRIFCTGTCPTGTVQLSTLFHDVAAVIYFKKPCFLLPYPCFQLCPTFDSKPDLRMPTQVMVAHLENTGNPSQYLQNCSALAATNLSLPLPKPGRSYPEPAHRPC